MGLNTSPNVSSIGNLSGAFSSTGTGSVVLNTNPSFSNEAIAITTNNLPSIRHILNLDFANSQSIDPRITFTRASIATRCNKKGFIETVPSGVARIDFDPVTLECNGLLIESASTNLFSYSEQFDNSYWTKRSASTITPNAITAPDGTLTADKHVSTDTATNATYIGRVGSFGADNTVYCASWFVKRGTQSTGRLLLYSRLGVSSYASVSFDYDTRLIIGITNNGSVAGTTAGMVSVGNGWFRVWAASNMLTGSDTTGARIVPAYWGTPASIGSEYGYVWGGMLEAGVTTPSSYIPTTTAQVTRNADAVSITGTNFSDWFNTSGGTFYALANVTSGANVLTANTAIITSTASTTTGYTVTYSSTNAATALTLGAGAYMRIAYYPKALSAANLQALTTT